MSTRADTGIFAGCVSCEDCVPLAWRDRDRPLTDGELFRLQERSLRALRAEPADEHEEQNPEMLRLHEKLDALMESVGRLLAAHHPAPAARNLRLSRRGVAWSMPAEQAPAAGGYGVIELHLHPRLLQPLLLPARIVAVHPGDGGATVEAAFEPIAEIMESALERHVFRRHRRAVAETRRQNA